MFTISQSREKRSITLKGEESFNIVLLKCRIVFSGLTWPQYIHTLIRKLSVNKMLQRLNFIGIFCLFSTLKSVKPEKWNLWIQSMTCIMVFFWFSKFLIQINIEMIIASILIRHAMEVQEVKLGEKQSGNTNGVKGHSSILRVWPIIQERSVQPTLAKHHHCLNK